MGWTQQVGQLAEDLGIEREKALGALAEHLDDTKIVECDDRNYVVHAWHGGTYVNVYTLTGENVDCYSDFAGQDPDYVRKAIQDTISGRDRVRARYVDTCLSCYLQDSYSRDGQCLLFCSLGSDLDETVEALYDSGEWYDFPEEITEDACKDAIREALRGVDLRWIDPTDGTRREEPPDDRDDEEPYLYVVLEWDR